MTTGKCPVCKQIVGVVYNPEEDRQEIDEHEDDFLLKACEGIGSQPEEVFQSLEFSLV